MTTHSFSLVLDRKPSDDQLDALFEAGLDDSTPATVSGNGWLHVDREASSMLEAVTSAIRDVHTAGLEVSAVHSGDLVSLKEVASRVNRSNEAVRLWSLGRRGPGGFPPAITSAEGWSLWSWVQVSNWLNACHLAEVEVGEDELTLAVVDLLVRARSLLGNQALPLAQILQATDPEQSGQGVWTMEVSGAGPEFPSQTARTEPSPGAAVGPAQ